MRQSVPNLQSDLSWISPYQIGLDSWLWAITGSLDAVGSTHPVAVEMKRSIRTLFHRQIANPSSVLSPRNGIGVIGGSPWVIARCDAVVYLSGTVTGPDRADQAGQQ